MTKNKIIVLGATSFIGFSNLKFNPYKNWFGSISKQKDKYRQKIKKQRIKLLNNNLITFNFMKKSSYRNLKDFNIIINCIGFTKNFNNNKFNYSKAKKNFDLYFFNLREQLKNSDVKMIIHIGSSFEYGDSDTKITENTMCKPNTKYGKYKLYEHNKLKKLARKNLKIINIRCFSIFGFLNKENSLIEYLKNNNQITLNNPLKKIDMMDVFFLNKLIIKLIKSSNNLNSFEIINFCSGNSFTVKNLILKLKLKKKILFSKKTIKSQSLRASNKKMLKFIDFDKEKNFIRLRKYLG